MAGPLSKMVVDEKVSTIQVTNYGIITVPVPWPCKGTSFTSSRLYVVLVRVPVFVVSVKCRISLDLGFGIWDLGIGFELKYDSATC